MIFFFNLNSNCFNLLDLRNLQEQVQKAFSHQTLFRPFTVWVNYSSDRENFSNFLRQFFLTVDQTIFGNKILLSTALYEPKMFVCNLQLCFENFDFERVGFYGFLLLPSKSWEMFPFPRLERPNGCVQDCRNLEEGGTLCVEMWTFLVDQDATLK